jgi:protein CpxP
MKKLSLIVAVALGTLVACSIATAQDAAKKGRRGFGGGQGVEQMKKDLNLTDAQVTKVKAVMEERHKKMQELRGETDREARREKMRGIMEESNKKMKEILTPEQYKKLEEMRPQRGKKKDGGERKKGRKKAE